MTKTANSAHVTYPASSFAETSGSYVSADGKVQTLSKAVGAPVEWDNLRLFAELC